MADKKGYIDADGEVRELDDGFFKKAKVGRPPLPEGEKKQQTLLMIDPDIKKRLSQEKNMSKTVNKALRQHFGL